jgi:hypothetical protein
MEQIASPRKPGRWWKMYAIGAVLWLLGTIAIYASNPSSIRWSLVVDALISALCAFGLTGFAWQRAILKARLWKLLIPLVPVWDVAYPTLLLPNQPAAASPSVLVAVVAILVLLALIKYVALFRYAYRSDHLWTDQKLRTIVLSTLFAYPITARLD